MRLGGPGPLVLLVALATGVIGGAIWAGIAGFLRYWYKVPEVLLSGNHAAIDAWRRAEGERLTREREGEARPRGAEPG